MKTGLEVEWQDASQLAADLGSAVMQLGVVYTQLSGHAAAAQAVVQELQRCMVFLHGRHVQLAGVRTSLA